MIALRHFLFRHAGLIGGILLGLALFFVVISREEQTRDRVTQVERNVTRVVSESPCTGLSTRKCALKIFRALPPDDRREIERRVVAEERRIARRIARRNDARGESAGSIPGANSTPGPGGTSPGSSAPSPGPGGSTPGPSGPTGPQGPPGSPGASPTPAPTPRPTLDPNPIGPLDLPPIDVPGLECVPIPMLNPCS